MNYFKKFIVLSLFIFNINGAQIVLETAVGLLQNPEIRKTIGQISVVGFIKAYEYIKYHNNVPEAQKKESDLNKETYPDDGKYILNADFDPEKALKSFLNSQHNQFPIPTPPTDPEDPNKKLNSIKKATVSAVGGTTATGISHLADQVISKKSSITQEKRKMLDYYNFTNDEYDNMVKDIKETYGENQLSQTIIKEICELNKFAKSLSVTLKTEYAKFKYRTHHVFNIDNARKKRWNGLHDKRYIKNISENIFKIVDEQKIHDNASEGYILYRDMNTIPKYKTFFINMTSEEVIELSFEYFETIDLNSLDIKDNKASKDITTKSGLRLRYVIDFTPNQFSFFAMPIKFKKNEK